MNHNELLQAVTNYFKDHIGADLGTIDEEVDFNSDKELNVSYEGQELVLRDCGVYDFYPACLKEWEGQVAFLRKDGQYAQWLKQYNGYLAECKDFTLLHELVVEVAGVDMCEQNYVLCVGENKALLIKYVYSCPGGAHLEHVINF